jgi:hypothetical protein
VGALVNLIDADGLQRSLAKQPWSGQTEDDVGKLVRGLLDERRRAALEALPAISRKNFGSDPAGWQRWWSGERHNLGPQVVPEGWVFPV